MDKTYSERAESAINPVAFKLLRLMDEKQTNLCLTVDVTSAKELLEIAENLGPHIALLKTHIDIIKDFTRNLTKNLVEIAERHRFLLFEDRKFADIGNTVRAQYQGGLYHISDWADMVTAHTVSGPGIIESLKGVGLPKGRGLLLLAEMSSKDNLATGEYTKKTVEWAKEHAEFVIGFIAQRQLDPTLLTLTPGVHFAKSGDSLGQQYLSPYKVIYERKSDMMIVGRGILEAKDPIGEAVRYREVGWEAYRKRID